MNTRILFSVTAALLLVSGNAAYAQMGQSGWQTPSGSSSGDSSSSQGLGQSGWQSGNSNAGSNGDSGSSGLGQSGWQQPYGSAQQQMQQFQQPLQQQEAPQQMSQSGWQTPAGNNGGAGSGQSQVGQSQMGQSGWQQPAAASNQLGQSGWQTPNNQQQPLQGNASKTTTLGDALSAGQGNSGQSDIDPAAAAMMMSQLNGGANGAGAMNPGAMMGANGADPMNAMAQQLAPALGALMTVMPSNNNNGMVSSNRPFTGGFAVPRRTGTYYPNTSNNNGGIGSTVNKILPTSMMQGMMRQMMYQGMSRAMYH